MRRVDELTQKRLKEAYPDMFEPKRGRRNGKIQSNKVSTPIARSRTFHPRSCGGKATIQYVAALIMF